MEDNKNNNNSNNLKQEQKNHLIFTYGTLKTNLPNHNLIQSLISTCNATFVSNAITLNPFPLIIGPYNIPYLINLPNLGHKIKGELYSVTQLGLNILDELEGVSKGHYERRGIELEGEFEGVEAYFAGKFGEEMWVKVGKVGIEEYTEVEAGRYVKGELRDEGFDFLEAIRLFLE